MEEIYRSGKAKAIGVANWSIPYLEKLRETWTVVPAVNQVELHPFLPQHELREYCSKLGILMEAYSPLGSTGKVHVRSRSRIVLTLKGAPIMSDPEIQEMAKRYGVSAATILVSYHVNKGVVVLPKSVSTERIAANKHIIPLSLGDLTVLDSLAANGKAQRISKWPSLVRRSALRVGNIYSYLCHFADTPLWGFGLGFTDWYGPVKA